MKRASKLLSRTLTSCNAIRTLRVRFDQARLLKIYVATLQLTQIIYR